ncbi:MAG TPA: argininosuccinate lyase [Burkholderiaceae bacterium]|nr:argininosuccinate lyase [Burkholderiaceae bacterium]
MTQEKQQEKPHDKLWGGRFTQATDVAVENFTASVAFDRRLYRHDIMGSVAHAKMLAHVGVLTQAECDAIVKGLKQIETEIDAGNFAWSVAFEDVHMNIEARLIDRIGEVGKKLHTGRSRNDQVATDLRLYLRDGIDALADAIKELQLTLVDIAEREADTAMPGFTHLQTAQPVTFGHHMLAWFEMLQRDRARLNDVRRRVNVLPLGAAALAGTSFPIDRPYTAKLLGFDSVSENSMDAVSDRDFAIEFVSACALVMMHLSRFSEELILWSSAQFDFVALPDAYCTGSSIMPQKKNPDVPELVRGKSGRVFGDLVALLTLMKGQPLAYNKDNQEDKEPVFDALDTALASVQVYAGMLRVLEVKRDNLLRAFTGGYATATDLADYLVRKGVAFRDAHEIVGKAVRLAIESGRDLTELGLDELKRFSKAIEADVFALMTPQGSLQARDHLGGTAPVQVRAACRRARERLSNNE